MFKTMTTKKKKRGLLFLVLSALLGIGGVSAFASGVSASPIEETRAATSGTVIYTPSGSKDAYSVSSSGDVPDGVTASYTQTYTTTVGQITKSNSATLTLSGIGGYKITGYTLSMKSNGNTGTGSLKYSIDDGAESTLISNSTFANKNWNGGYSTSYVDVKKTCSIELAKTVEKIEFVIAATVNSLYCESWSFTYEKITVLPTSISINEKPTSEIIYLSEGETQQLSVSLKSASSDTGEDITDSSVKWSIYSSDPEGSVTVSDTGLVTANTTGGDAYVLVECVADTSIYDMVEIIVAARTFTGFAIDTTAFDTSYYIGDSWDTVGVVVNASYTVTGVADPVYVDITSQSAISFDPTEPSIGTESVTIKTVVTIEETEYSETKTVNGITVTEVSKFTKLAATEPLVSGKYVIGYDKGSEVAALPNNFTGSDKPSAVSVTSTDGVITLEAATSKNCIFDIVVYATTTSSTTTYTLSISSGSTYITGASSSSTDLKTSSSSALWTLGTAQNGSFRFVSPISNSGRVLSYRSSGIFGHYGSSNPSSGSSSYYDLELYKLENSGDEAFVQVFMNETESICATSENLTSATSDLTTYWAKVSTVVLADTDKTSLQKVTASKEATASIEEEAMARYDHIVGKYGVDVTANFLGRTITAGQAHYVFGNSDDASTYITILAVAGGVVLASGLFFAIKRKTSREEE